MRPVEEELTQLEKEIRRLKIEYDSYFAGGRPRAPSETEWRVQKGLKRFADNQGKMKFVQRLRYNNLAARYAKFSEIWRQRTRRMEAGHSPFGYSKTARELEQRRLVEEERRHAARLEGGAFRIGVSDPLKESEQVQALYRHLVTAKKELGEKSDVNFEQFHKFVQKKTEQLKKQMKCQQVEYVVSIENGQVKLKAKGF